MTVSARVTIHLSHNKDGCSICKPHSISVTWHTVCKLNVSVDPNSEDYENVKISQHVLVKHVKHSKRYVKLKLIDNNTLN